MYCYLLGTGIKSRFSAHSAQYVIRVLLIHSLLNPPRMILTKWTPLSFTVITDHTHKVVGMNPDGTAPVTDSSR